MATLGLLHGPLVAIFGTSLLVSLRFVPMTLYLGVEMAAQPPLAPSARGCHHG